MKFKFLLVFVYSIVLVGFSNAQWINKAATRGVAFGETMTRDNAGNIYVAGTFVCDLVFDTDSLKNISCGDSVTPPPPVSRFDGYIVKYDSDGKYIWSRQILGTAGNELFEVEGISADPAGNCVITGSYKGTLDFSGNVIANTTAISDIFIARYLADGTFDWVVSNFSRTNASFSKANTVASDASGNSYISGALKDSVVFNGDQDTLSLFNQELFIAKFNNLGSFQWIITSIGDSTASSAEILDIRTDADNNLFVTGNFKDTVNFGGDTLHTQPAGSQEIFIAKYNEDGELIWVIQEDAASSNAISLDQTGEKLFVAGQFTSNANIGGDAHTTSVGNIGAFIAQYDTSGVYNWSEVCTTAAGDSSVTGRSVSVDDLGAAYLTGNFGKKTSIAPVISSGTKSATGNGSLDIFIAKFNEVGNAQWIRTLGKDREDDCKDIIATDSSNIYIAGYFADSIRIDSQLVVNESLGYNAYTAELDPCAFYESTVIAAATEICQGDSALLQATIGADYTYQWEKDGVLIPSADDDSYYATEAGTYRAIVSSLSFPCVRYSLPVTIVVNSLPSTAIIKNGESVFCTGDSVKYSANLGYTYQWIKDNTPIATATEYQYAAKVNGVYKAALQNTFGCRDTTEADTVVVYNYPDATISPLGKFTICSGDSVTISAIAVTGQKYQWFKNNVALTNDTLSVYKAKTDGIYKVTIENEIGCSTTSLQDTISTMSSPSAVVSYSDPLTFCSDRPTTLYSNTGLGLDFQWLLNGTAIPSATGTTYQPAVSGDYSISVENSIGCTTISPEVTVTVNSQPSAIVSLGGSTTICAGDSVKLEAPSGAGYTYRWQRNLSDISGEVTDEYYAKTSGSYRLILTDNNSCADTSSTVAVAVNGLPPATITAMGDTIFCAGDQVELKANSGTSLSYQWFESGNSIPLATAISHIVSASGVYSVEVTNSASCSRESVTKTVIVYSTPSATLNPDGPTIFCEGDSVDLEAATGAGYSYLWKKNGFTIPGAISSTYRVRTSGDYSVVVSVNSSCSATSTVQSVTVNPVTKPILTVNGTNVSTSFFASYQWNKDGVAIPGATLQIYDAIESGKYTVTIPSANGCPATSDTATVCVPAPYIEVSGSLLKASSGTGYQWYLEGFEITNAVLQQYLTNTSGNYKVKVRLADGCESFSEEVLVCIPAPTITLGANNVLSASGGIAFQWYLDEEEIPGATTQIHVAEASGSYTVKVENAQHCESVSMPLELLVAGLTDGILSEELSLYPNPAGRELNIKLDNAFIGEVSLTLMDLLGKEHQTFVWMKAGYLLEDQLNIGSLKEGIYILKLQSGNQIIYSKFKKAYDW